jgi:hypothetical protein
MYFFTDANGTNLGQGTMTIPANRQIAAFLNEAPFNGSSSFSGAFTFSSSALVSAIALRGFTNERSEFLLTTLPVAQPGLAIAGPVALPHFADGGGWKTQVVLVNPGDSVLSGSVQFLNTEGETLRTSSYTVQPRSSVRIQTEGTEPAIQTGSVRIAAGTGGSVPNATSIFSFSSGGVTVSMAGTSALPSSTAAQLYAEVSGTIRSGFAIANPSAGPVTVTLSIAGMQSTVTVPANGQRALFLNEIPEFSSLPIPFQGVLALSSPAPLAVTSLRGRTNERGDFLITTTAPVDQSIPASSSELLFPHFTDGGGYSTQFILFGQTTSGTTYFFNDLGQPRTLLFQ